MAKVQLIKAPLDDGYPSIDEWYLPLELMQLARAVEATETEVEILDGTHLSLNEIIERIDTNSKFIGITFTSLSIKSLQCITAAAKRLGLFVVLGGQAATGDCDELIKEEDVDIVVLRDGEDPIQALSKLEEFSPEYLRTIPNLLFRSKNGYEKTHTFVSDLSYANNLPRNIGGLDPEDYISRYDKETHTLKNINATRPAHLYSKKGCPRTCSFCARVDKTVRLREPLDVINEINYLVEEYGIDYLVDISDTWIQKEWLYSYKREYALKIPKKIPMTIFADIRDITPDICKDLKTVGVDNVLVGIESGSERILKLNRKVYSRKTIVTAVRNLSLTGIMVSASFVIGLLGEDDDSLCETERLCEELYKMGNVRCYCNITIPLPGSMIWREMVKLLGGDHRACKSGFHYNLNLAREELINNFTQITGGLAKLEMVRNRILEFNDLRILEYAR